MGDSRLPFDWDAVRILSVFVDKLSMPWPSRGGVNANRNIMQEVDNPLKSNYTDQYAFDSLDPNKPFVEVGYGIDNIFNLFRIQAFHRLTYLDHGNPERFRLLASFNFHF